MLQIRAEQWKLFRLDFKPSRLSSSTWSTIAGISLLIIGTWRHFYTSHNPSPLQQEAWVEWISWAFLFLFSRYLCSREAPAGILDSGHTENVCLNRRIIWGAGALAVASQLLSSQNTPTWALPLTTIAISVVPSSISKTSPTNDDEDDVDEKGSVSSISLEAVSTDVVEHIVPPIVVAFNATCCLLLFQFGNPAMSWTFPFILARIGAMYLITKLKVHTDKIRSVEADSVIDDLGLIVGALSQPALVILTILLVIVQPDLHISTFSVLGHALAQSTWWLSMIILLCTGLRNTVANLDTIAISVNMALSAWPSTTVTAAMSALLASTTQSILVLQPSANVRKAVYSCILVFAISLWIRHDPRLAAGAAMMTKPQLTHGHPTEHLIMRARAEFDEMMSRQSTTIEQAEKEYRRRYRRAPPLGFDKWFELAQSHDFMLIDEFDTIMQTFEPFYGIDPGVLKQRVSKVLERASKQINIYNVTNGAMSRDENQHEIADRMTNPTWLEIVPYNLSIAVNGYGEPMVSAPWETVHKAIEDAKQTRSYKGSKFQVNIAPVLSVGGQSGWSASSQACSVHSSARQIECPAAIYDLSAPLHFISNASASKDVCENCELLQQEGIFLKAETLNVAHELVPIWSPSKPSNFHDILYPASDYIQARSEYQIHEDSAWSDKGNSFFWVGNSVGGHVDETNWDKMQRQRLVLRTQKGSTEPIHLLEETQPGSSIWRSRYSTMTELTHLFSTRITSNPQCDKVACDLENKAFSPEKEGPRGTAYRHKFILDIDGNAFSSRFYRYLKSNSAVVKQTAFKEWHDDRLVPWVHYIPVSTSYRELPELARFFATTKMGDQLAERIARESTVWHDMALRNVDLQLVWLRMLLEYGRMMNPDMTAA